MTAQLRTLRDAFVRTFSNVPFGVAMLGVWGILTLIGVVIAQNQEPSSYAASYPPALARAILRMHFDDIYHSWWYLISVGLVLTSMATATFAKVIPRRLPPLRAVKVDAIPLHAHFRARGSAEVVRARIEAYFAKRGWTVRKRSFDGVEWSFADKFNWARTGVLVNHAAILIIAAGTALYWWLGFAGNTVILTGQSVRIPQTGAIIALHDFHYTIKPIATKGGIVYQPIDYVSHLRVVGKSGVPKNMTIRVNHPINIDGTLYYQSSYGFGVTFDTFHDGKRIAALSDRTLLEGQTLSLPGSIRSVEYERFVPTVDRTTGMPSADPRVNDPAIAIAMLSGGVPVGQTLVPLHTRVDLGGGWAIEPMNDVLFTGLQYRYDPGALLVAIGAFTLLLGLIITFYFLPARLFVRVDKISDDECDVGLAATTVKGYDIYETPFRELCAELATSTEVTQA